MTWPTVAVNTTNCDSTGDSPSLFRADVLDAIQKLNAIIASPPFGSGVRLAFPQAAAPSGWTQDTTDAATDRMLRVVNTTGGGTGGMTGHSPILMNVVPSHTHAMNFNTGTESVGHSHSVSDPGHSHTFYAQRQGNSFTGVTFSADFNTATPSTNSATTGITIGAETATHTHNVNGTSAANGSAANWQPRYIDLIICSKD